MMWDCLAAPPPECLRELLASREFYGMGILEDLARLRHEFGIEVAFAFDFLNSWPELVPGGGLAGLTNRVLGMEIPKGKSVSTSDWNQRPLSGKQKAYAAADAFCSCAVAE